LADRAPHVVTLDDGREMWVYEDNFYPQVGLNAVAGRPKHEWSMEPARFDEMRRGCWDVEARVHDMDLDGIYASLCFPSLIAGFAGTIFATSKDADLGLACLRAWNDWHLEDWAGPHPDRIIPLQLAWLRDPEIAAADVYANAERGFKAVSFPENPVDLRMPSMHDEYWDPFLRACEETETVVCLHNGSSSWTAARSPGAPLELYTSLFPVNALVTAADWLWARIPTRYPRIKVAFSEGGISWVPMLIDRIEYVLGHSAVGSHGWDDPDLSPTDAMRRNFWFCTIDLGSTFALRDHIGLDHICLESDYPHADSTWPETQAVAARGLAPLTDDEIRKVTWQNASLLFRHPVPPELQLP
ncbi:MAG TPA: amidohydrolase family protein, partial [Acidimicrobiia bacterium]|nr:amidohydrolase family protein [Acidimicrobiia bacterium]